MSRFDLLERLCKTLEAVNATCIDDDIKADLVWKLAFSIKRVCEQIYDDVIIDVREYETTK